MKPLKEIINDNYVIVPEFSYTGMGYMVVSRGDMTEYEWRVWKRTREVNSVKKLLSDGVMNKKTKKAIRVGLETIVEFLKSEGIDSAIVGSSAVEPIRSMEDTRIELSMEMARDAENLAL